MMKFEMFKGKNDEHYFRLLDDIGNILLSSEGYKKKDSLLMGIESVKKNMPVASGIEKKEASNGKYFFNVKSSNGQVVGTSMMFDSIEAREKWLLNIQKDLNEIQVIEK